MDEVVMETLKSGSVCNSLATSFPNVPNPITSTEGIRCAGREEWCVCVCVADFAGIRRAAICMYLLYTAVVQVYVSVFVAIANHKTVFGKTPLLFIKMYHQCPFTNLKNVQL